MKINWGTGIALFYLSFMAAMIFVVIRSKSYDHSLVMENYYEEDLKYQKRYDEISNALKDSTFHYHYLPNEQKLEIKFSNQKNIIKGKLLFYRPSNSKLDFELPLKLNADQTMEISTKNLALGRWRVKCNWKTGAKEYFKEIDLSL